MGMASDPQSTNQPGGSGKRPLPNRPGRLGRWARRLAAATAGVLLLAGVIFCWLWLQPLPDGLAHPTEASIELLDRNGVPLRLSRQGTEGFKLPVTLPEVPEALIHATLAAEDQRFWTHTGVDVRAIGRAVWQRIRYRRVISGGSTITMQLIKLADPRPRTLWNKMREAVLALKLEQRWSKESILAGYLNRIDYGNLCLGAREASRWYFGKPLKDLSVAESALLAGIPQAPSRLNPTRHPAGAIKRRQWILQRMQALGWLAEAERPGAENEPLKLEAPGRRFAAPHFCDLVLNTLEESELPGGNRIRTSLDSGLQAAAEQAVERHVRALRGKNVHEAALVAIDNRDGSVLALVGSPDYSEPVAGQVNGALAPRSPGSALKPFTYWLAFERGSAPSTVLPDIPTEFPTPTGLYRPYNYDRHYLGPVSCRVALGNSLNVPAVRILSEIGGADTLLKRLRECGIQSLTNDATHYGLGLTIGNAEVRLLELANAYATLARLGEYLPWRVLADSASGPRHTKQRVGSAQASWLVADILADNEARGQAFGYDSMLRFDFPVAAKTGTSSNFRDNWAFGFTPEFTVGVWVGNFDGSPMQSVSGVSGAAPILHEMMEALHKRSPITWFTRPPGLVQIAVNPLTGHQPAPGTTGEVPVPDWFIAANPPPKATPGDYAPDGRILLPAIYAAWYEGANPAIRAAMTVEPQGNRPLRILTPLSGSTYFLDPDLPGQGRWLRLRSEGPPGRRWHSTTLKFRGAEPDPECELAAGRHELVLESPGTEDRRRTTILVKQLRGAQ